MLIRVLVFIVAMSRAYNERRNGQHGRRLRRPIIYLHVAVYHGTQSIRCSTVILPKYISQVGQKLLLYSFLSMPQR